MLDDTAKITSSLFTLGESDKKENTEENSPIIEPPEETNDETEKIKRNQTAIVIRNRIKEKLEGADPDKATVVSVEQQVDYVITESKAIHNLALMYEGWTSWV